MILGPVLVAYVLTATFSALRAFAIWNHSRLVFALVFALGMVPAGLQLSLLIHSQVSLGFWGHPPFLCNAERALRGHTDHVYALMTRIPVILAEGTVVALTWRKTWVGSGSRRASLVGASNVAACLLRDGTLYFLVMMALQAVQIVILFHPTIASLGAFLDTIPPILVGRFIMHLSRLSRPSGAQAYGTTSSAAHPLTSALPFSTGAGAPTASVWLTDIGELGADLEHSVLGLGGHSDQSVEGETTEDGVSAGEDVKREDRAEAGKDVECGGAYHPPTRRYFPSPTTPSTPSTSYELKSRTT